MTSLTKNPHTPSKKFFSSADWKTCRVFWDFYRVCTAYRTGEIPAQSHVRLGGVFFPKIPETTWVPKCLADFRIFGFVYDEAISIIQCRQHKILNN